MNPFLTALIMENLLFKLRCKEDSWLDDEDDDIEESIDDEDEEEDEDTE